MGMRSGGREMGLPLLISGRTEETRATSEQAAISVEGGRTAQRQYVYEEIVAAGDDGCTDDELQIILDLVGHSECPRRLELVALGKIEQKRDERGNAVKRLTRTGRKAVVWIAVQEKRG